MEKTIGGRIRELRKEKRLSQAELGLKVGRSKGTISQWEAGITHPGGEALLRLAVVLGRSPDWLVHGQEPVSDTRASYQGDTNVAEGPSVQGMCPEISWVQAGQWAEVCHVDLDPESVNWYPRPPGASEQTFVLRVVGESMIPEYMPGTLIYIDPERSAETGKDVIAVMTDTGEATFKRFIEEPGAGKMLKALNPAWMNPYLPINGNCRVIGVVVADMRLR